jgi:glyoxylase-like metal-dependent hydrolase (beta-lactamase superfamily II)
VNTSFPADHTGGNALLAKNGSNTQGNPLPIVAHENVLARLSASAGPGTLAPTAAWPTDAYVKHTKDFFFNGEPILVFHPEAGVTDGDSIVHFRRSDVLVAGETWNTTRYPIIDLAHGGGVQGVIDGLNYLLDIAVPGAPAGGRHVRDPGARPRGRRSRRAGVPGHGDDRARPHQGPGAARVTLAQVKAARPTLDYDRQYGADTGPWTTSQFVEAIYTDLSARSRPRGEEMRQALLAVLLMALVAPLNNCMGSGAPRRPPTRRRERWRRSISPATGCRS